MLEENARYCDESKVQTFASATPVAANARPRKVSVHRLCDYSLTSVVPVFHDLRNRTSESSTDLAGDSPQVCDDAVASVLQFGACVPPMSPWTGVSRFAPGYRYRGTQRIGVAPMYTQPELASLNPSQQADCIEGLLDSILQETLTENAPVLLFSGGVDSGLIAARLAALGRDDSVLVNYSFGSEDREADLARRMAKTLGLTYLQVEATRNPCDVLQSPGKIYPMPFGDHSVVPTSDLAHSVVDLLGSGNHLIIDGTGADAGFGLLAKVDRWRSVYRVPRSVRGVADRIYKRTYWLRPGEVESRLKILSRAAQYALAPASIAQNGLAGSHFGSSRVQEKLEFALLDWISGTASENSRVQAVASDFALVCAGIVAQKAQPIFQAAGYQVLYPFLHPKIVGPVLSAVPSWQITIAKEALKIALTRAVPRRMVYRPKSGFVDPSGSMYYSEWFISYLEDACSAQSRVSSSLNVSRINEAVRALKSGKELPVQTRKLLWAAVFTDRWYRTAVGHL